MHGQVAKSFCSRVQWPARSWLHCYWTRFCNLPEGRRHYRWRSSMVMGPGSSLKSLEHPQKMRRADLLGWLFVGKWMTNSGRSVGYQLVTYHYINCLFTTISWLLNHQTLIITANTWGGQCVIRLRPTSASLSASIGGMSGWHMVRPAPILDGIHPQGAASIHPGGKQRPVLGIAHPQENPGLVNYD